MSVPAKKQEIIERALERFRDGGFFATGVDTVMAETGISKRTLYKYFPSKEELIEAVLDHYGCDVEAVLFEPALARASDLYGQIAAVFDVRRELMEADAYRGCLAMKAAHEYAGRHQGIMARGRASADYAEQRFAELCAAAGRPDSEPLGRRINVLFQGAVLTSEMRHEASAFEDAKALLRDLLG